jgi:3-oxoacyl-[acyl-carrier-protein] synthase II
MSVPERIREPVVVTGLGVVSSVGVGHPEFWSSLVSGQSGESPITTFDASGFPVHIAAEVKNTDVLRYWPEPVDRLTTAERRTQFGLAAAALALHDAGLSPHDPRLRRGAVVVGAGLGIVCLEDLIAFLHQDSVDLAAFGKQLDRIEPASMLRQPPDLVGSLCASGLGVRGPNLTVTSACAAGTQAIGLAFRMLAEGHADIALCGAADSMINPVGLAGFVLIGAASKQNRPGHTSRPFDRARTGLVLGEGAGMAVLETLASAQRRDAHIYAEVLGYGTTMDAYHLTDPDPVGGGAARAMRHAVREAGLEPADIHHVNAHGTSTVLNDKTETKAIKTVFGDHAARIPVCSNKSMIGHLVAACGAAEFVCTVLTVYNQVIPPTINYQHPDPECDLDYVPNTARKAEIGFALSNSFGFGGQNASIVVGRHDFRADHRDRKRL